MSVMLSNAEAQGLFSRSKVPEQVEKIRPLAALSDFVVEQLPGLLARTDHEVVSELARAIAPFTAESIERLIQPLSTRERMLAGVDLTLLAHAMQHHEWPFFAALQPTLTKYCEDQGRLPTYLYEDCVLNNPLSKDPRLFTTGANGAAERDFLVAHLSIESELEAIIASLIKTLALANTALPSALGAILETLHTIYQPLDYVRKIFAQLHRMPTSSFTAFRRYYAMAPHSSHFGPSGRFSAKFHTLRVLTDGLAIKQVVPEYFHEIFAVFAYYPRQDRDVLLNLLTEDAAAGIQSLDPQLLVRLRQNAKPKFASLNDLTGYPALPSPLAAVLKSEVHGIRSLLDKITGVHFGLVCKYIVKTESTAVMPSPQLRNDDLGVPIAPH